MLLYCLTCRKNTESENSKVVKTKNGRVMLLSRCDFVTVKSQDLSKSKKLVEY